MFILAPQASMLEPTIISELHIYLLLLLIQVLASIDLLVNIQLVLYDLQRSTLLPAVDVIKQVSSILQD